MGHGRSGKLCLMPVTKKAKSKETKRREAAGVNRKRNARREGALRLLGDKCSECGSSENLTFGRINPGEISELRRLWTAPNARLAKELKISTIRCGKCHVARWPRVVKHGTVYGYDVRGCRCDLCVEARRAARRKSYANIKTKQLAPIV